MARYYRVSVQTGGRDANGGCKHALHASTNTDTTTKGTTMQVDVNGAYRGSHSTTRGARRHGQNVTTFRTANGGRAFPRTKNLEVTTDCLIRYADGTFGRIAKDYVKPRARKTDAVADAPTKVTRAMPVTVTVARKSAFDAAHAESYS
jgi:hypothetical protein